VPERDEYFLGYRHAEQERLQRQAQELEQEARWLLDLVENLRERVLSQKLIGEAELDESMASVWHHLEDPQTLEIFALYFQAWGRKPEH